MDIVKEITSYFSNLSKRERSIVTLTGIALIVGAAYLAYQSYTDFIEGNKAKLQLRVAELKELPVVISKYKALNSRFTKLEQNLSQSQMSLEAVTKEVDKIVKEALGSSDYIFNNLPRNEDDKLMGRFQRQQYKITIDKVSIEQLVKLLHSLEQGKSPLFIEEIDLPRIRSKDEFKAVLYINSILEEI